MLNSWLALSLFLGQVLAGNKCASIFGVTDEREHGPSRFPYQSEQQIPLNDPKQEPGEPKLPLEIVPLIVSGPYINRVDLIFFSDGCGFIRRTSRN